MGKKIVSFEDYNRESEKSELQKVSRGFSKNTSDGHQIPGNTKMVYNKVTRKIDNVTKDMVDDKIHSMTNENHDILIGDVIIEINGDESPMRDTVEERIKTALKGIGQGVYLIVNGDEININD